MTTKARKLKARKFARKRENVKNFWKKKLTQVHRANFDNIIIFWQHTHTGQYVALLATKKARKLKAGKFAVEAGLLKVV